MEVPAGAGVGVAGEFIADKSPDHIQIIYLDKSKFSLNSLNLDNSIYIDIYLGFI